jgi:hypothetical protein
MEEFLLRMIERVGFPIATSAISFWAVYKLFSMREADKNGILGQVLTEAKVQTASLQGIDTKLGQTPICKAVGNDKISEVILMNVNHTNELLVELRKELTATAVASDLAVKHKDIEHKVERLKAHDDKNKEQLEMNRREIERLKLEKGMA